MSLPFPDTFEPGPPGPLHEPAPDDREPRTRPKLLFWDRSRIVIFLMVFFGMSVAIKHEDIPILSWGEVARSELQAKWWLFALAGLEILHQVHLFVCERSGDYNQFWDEKVWGAWERRMSKLNPWLRYRLGRMVKVVIWGSIALLIFSRIWGVTFLEALVQAPGRLWSNPFGNAGMPWFFQIFFALAFGIIQIGGIYWFLSRGGIDTYMPRDIKTRFSDVWGQDKVLDKVKENIVFLERPEEIESKGGHVPGGMLLWGPPGTGKTLMAEAVAGETGKPYVFVDPGAFIQMFVGIGALKVKRLFAKLRKLSLRYGGVIVFFDEADTLGNRGQMSGGFNRVSSDEAHAVARTSCCNGLHYVGENTAHLAFSDAVDTYRTARASIAEEPVSMIRRPLNIIMGGMGGGGMGVLQSLLTEMSGLKKPRGAVSRRIRSLLNMKPKQPPKYRILVMMATNMPSSLDEAMLRPGRIDRKYKVDYPTLEGRIKTFNGYFAKVRHVLTEDQVHRLAVMSPRASGASIKDIVNESLIVAIRKGRDTVTWPDVLEAKTFKMHGMADGVAATELEQHETAIHEAGHAVAFYFLARRSVIDIATIEQRGDVGGFVSPVPIEERKFDWRSELDKDVMIFLASLVAERMFFGGDNSVGVSGDMNSATTIVRRMLSRVAMGDTLTSHGLGDLSDSQRREFDLKVEEKLQELYQRTYELIDANRWFLAAIAHALQQHHTITGEDVDAIYKGTQGPTLDGAVYRSDGFLEQYGSYLGAAQDAHRAQSQIRAIMPRFDPHPVHAPVHYGMPVASRDPYGPPVDPADPYGPAAGGFAPNGGPPPPPPPPRP
ncbi:MAG: AAA family ATPase [Acidimicrobiales bacterium]|nr:AAA family ATPase [Acidimicrobiales bacterium]